MEKERILIVDDDPQITTFLKRYLEKHDYDVQCASDGEEMQRLLAVRSVDLCVLDVKLPGRSGLDLTRDIRKDSNLPILMLSGLDETFDRVVGLEFGADDYMTKPYEPRELLARVRSILRRSKTNTAQPDVTTLRCYRFGNWGVNLNDRTLTAVQNGQDVKLTTTEFELLSAFVQNPRTVFNRYQLLDLVRGRDSFVGDRTIDVHVTRLRKKIELDASDPKFIKTIHGIGYCFNGDVSVIS